MTPKTWTISSGSAKANYPHQLFSDNIKYNVKIHYFCELLSAFTVYLNITLNETIITASSNELNFQKVMSDLLNSSLSQT